MARKFAPGSTTPHYNRQPSGKHDSRDQLHKKYRAVGARDEAYFMNGGFKKQTTVARVLVWKSGMVTLRFLQYSGITIPRVSTTVLSCSRDTRAEGPCSERNLETPEITPKVRSSHERTPTAYTLLNSRTEFAWTHALFEKTGCSGEMILYTLARVSRSHWKRGTTLE